MRRFVFEVGRREEIPAGINVERSCSLFVERVSDFADDVGFGDGKWRRVGAFAGGNPVVWLEVHIKDCLPDAASPTASGGFHALGFTG